MKKNYSYTSNEMGEDPMENKIKLENKIKDIFNKDKIRVMDVIIGNRLIKEWKKLTGYKSNDNP
jgi:hypothetical protein